MNDGRFFRAGNLIIRRNALLCVRLNLEDRKSIEFKFGAETQKMIYDSPEEAQAYFEHFCKILV